MSAVGGAHGLLGAQRRHSGNAAIVASRRRPGPDDLELPLTLGLAIARLCLYGGESNCFTSMRSVLYHRPAQFYLIDCLILLLLSGAQENLRFFFSFF